MTEQHLPYWIQSADYTSVNFDAVPIEEAIEIVHTHDWKQEREAQAALRAEGEKVATPGIAFHHGPDTELHLLHLCPDEADRWTVHYVFRETVRRFWFWTGEVNKRVSQSNLDRSTVDRALALFFEDRHYDVLSVLDTKS